MENNWFVIFLFLALFFLFSGNRLRLSGTRRSTPKSPSSQTAPAYTAAKPHIVIEGHGSNMPYRAASPVPTSVTPSARPLIGRPRVVEGSDYLSNNPLSHLLPFQVGLGGEQRVVDQIQSILGQQWTVFRNVDLGDQKGDIDIVLVGPGGTWALEVKTYSGNFQVEKGRWYKETSNGRMAKMQRGPGAQLLTNAMRLCQYLTQHGLTHNNYVNRAIVMAGDASINIVSTGTPIWKLEDLDRLLASSMGNRRYSQEYIRLVVGVLERACRPETRLH